MALDVYKPCPYCTDKKIKFCCADIADEMTRINRQMYGGQQRTALKRLERLAETHPDTVWNEMSRVTLLYEEGRHEEVLVILEHLHAIHPDHPTVAAMHALSALNAHGYDSAREHIWRALRKNQGSTSILCALLRQVAAELLGQRRYLAARAYLTIAMRLASEKDREDIFRGLMAIDGSYRIPYPLRGVHSLRSIQGDSERSDLGHKAHRLAERGSFGPAAKRYDTLAESDPSDAAAHYNAALCHAWSGDQRTAAAAFMRAAKEESDFEVGAEYAALGQILRALESENGLKSREATFRIDSVSDAEERLEALPECVVRILDRSEMDEANESAAADEPMAERTKKAFELADRPLPDSRGDIALADCPRTLGFFTIEPPSEPEGSAHLRLVCADSNDFDACLHAISGIPGANLETPVDDNTHRFGRFVPAGFNAAAELVTRLPQIAASTERGIKKQHSEAVAENWLSTPQELLDGDTPEQAAGQPDRHVELAGLLYLLDVVQFDNRTDADPIAQYRQRLGLPARAELGLEPGNAMQSMSTVQMLRLRPADLDDRQLRIVKSRALLIHHWTFLDAVLQESLGRAQLLSEKQGDLTELTRLARERDDVAAALHWIGEAKSFFPRGGDDFLERAQWDLLEVSIRLDDGDSPETQAVLRDVLTYYGPKLPEVVAILAEKSAEKGIEMPTVSGIDIPGDDRQGIWTPDQPEPSEQKLWLPGS